jgi:hypothetical protein
MYSGRVLDDAVFTMKTNSANMPMDVTISLTDRKVVDQEKITTPAATFGCMKVSGNRKTTMSFLGKPSWNNQTGKLQLQRKIGMYDSFD